MSPTPAPLAPCIAVTGPPNSGKTTLLHLLDEALQLHPGRPSAYIVKGNPDGTGRYLHYSPELRTSLKPQVKGKWMESTVDQICEWIANARRNLELVLLDFGGKHSPENHRMLALCSHYIVLSRRFADPAIEQSEGAASWQRACEADGLLPLARIESLWQQGACSITGTAGAVEGTFRADASVPGDVTNARLIEVLTARLMSLRLPREPVAGVDLRLTRDWSPSDLPTLGGLLPNVMTLARSGAPLAFSGRAPVWIYLGAMHRALTANPGAVVRVSDPKVEGGWVDIPQAGPSGAAAEFPANALTAEWAASDRPGFCRLEFSIRTPDRFLPPSAIPALASLPRPDGENPPCPKVVVSGAGPIWLHMTYSRWLRSLPSVETIGVWDARFTTDIIVGP
jgi:hypothetical protein